MNVWQISGCVNLKKLGGFTQILHRLKEKTILNKQKKAEKRENAVESKKCGKPRKIKEKST